MRIFLPGTPRKWLTCSTCFLEHLLSTRIFLLGILLKWRIWVICFMALLLSIKKLEVGTQRRLLICTECFCPPDWLIKILVVGIRRQLRACSICCRERNRSVTTCQHSAKRVWLIRETFSRKQLYLTPNLVATIKIMARRARALIGLQQIRHLLQTRTFTLP